VQSLQLSGSLFLSLSLSLSLPPEPASGSIYALTMFGTCNYLRQFYDSADSGGDQDERMC